MTVTEDTADVRMRSLKTNRGKTFPPEPVTADDIAALLAACTPQWDGPQAEISCLRLRALIAVVYRTGVRISEALAFEDRDLHRRDKALIVQHGKGGKRRTVLMDDWGWQMLDRWLEIRHEKLPAGPIFCTIQGSNAGRSQWDSHDALRSLKAVGKRVDPDRRWYFHGMRHGFSVELMRDETVDIFGLMTVLGHTRPDTTLLYLRTIDPVQILKPIGERKPPRIEIPL